MSVQSFPEPGSIRHAQEQKPKPRGVFRYGVQWSVSRPLEADLGMLRQFPNLTADAPPGLREMHANWTEDDWFKLHREILTTLFPSFVHHRWSDWIIRCWVRSTNLGIMGAASSGKTWTVAALTLATWYADPAVTFALATSTTLPELKRRVLGVIFDLHREAQEHHPWLPGREVRAENGIYLCGPDGMPNLRRGIMGLPTMSSQGEVMKGIKGIGQKAPKVHHLCDEMQLTPPGFLSASANLASNPFYRLTGLGNPTNPDDPLGGFCEPEEGWPSIGESTVARTWKTRGGIALQLPGLDSPGVEDPVKFGWLTTKRFIEEIRKRYGDSDIRTRCFAFGAIPTTGATMVVADRRLVSVMGAADPPKFAGPVRHFAGFDPAFGGGDRAVVCFVDVGPDQDGQTLIAIAATLILPVESSPGHPVEDNLAMAFRLACERRTVSPENSGFDCTFSSIASAIARIWSTRVQPVMFSNLPVDPQPELGESEITLQDNLPSDRFGKRVTQIVYRQREVIETGCVRGLPEEIAQELSRRRWSVTSRTGATLKLDVEPKAAYSARHGESPDYSDSFAVALEVIQRSGVVLRRVVSDRDEAISLAPPAVPAPDFRGIDSAEDDALLARLQRRQEAANATIAVSRGIPYPPPPPNRALMAEIRIQTHKPRDDQEPDPELPLRIRSALRSISNAVHGS